jgi:hypothetical protein
MQPFDFAAAFVAYMTAGSKRMTFTSRLGRFFY